MKVEFIALRFKNLLSYGNDWTTVNLDEGDAVLMVGKNGHGKSTLLEALHFGLFGEPFRNIRKNQLVNSVNGKDCLVEVLFRVAGAVYLVRRGLKPALFEVYKDGAKLPHDAKAKDHQRHLETQILRFNSKSFTQIVVLGSATFMPFMQLPAGIRRKVIEDLLDITAFGDMMEIAKRKASNCRSRISEARERERILQERERGKMELLRRVQTVALQQDEELKEKYREQFSLRQETEAKIREVRDAIDKLKPKLDEFERVQRLVVEGESAKDRIHVQLRNAVAWVDRNQAGETCNRCGQTFPPDANELEKRKSEIVEFESFISLAESKIAELKIQVESLRVEVAKNDELVAKLNGLQGEWRMVNRHCDELAAKIEAPKESADVSKIENEIAEVRRELREKLDKLEEEQIELKHLNAAVDLLRDEGVKSDIVKTYVPVINRLVNGYLAEMDFNVSFHLDDQFEETIKSRHRDDFSYFSFSEGEKQRIDLALLFTWREIARLKNSTNTNLVVLDEITDSSLDAEGVESFFKILRTAGEKISIFVVSHRGNVADNFDRVILAKKTRGFSHLVEDRDEVDRHLSRG